LDEIASNITSYLRPRYLLNNYDYIVGIGDGGFRMLYYLQKTMRLDPKKVVFIKCSHVFLENGKIDFTHDIDSVCWENLKILLVDDVIARGDTVDFVSRQIRNRGGDSLGLISGIISCNSPYFNKCCFPFTCIEKGVFYKNIDPFKKDPFWYPPIFSLRHLLFGDLETTNFYKVFSEKYLNCEESIFKYFIDSL
jgi:hypothetical protein